MVLTRSKSSETSFPITTSKNILPDIEKPGERKHPSFLIFADKMIKIFNFSPYPEAFLEQETLYLCKFCFRYFVDEIALQRHERVKCNQRTKQLGRLVYSYIHNKNRLVLYEISCCSDSERMLCQDLCLFSKMFIGDKSLSFDVTCFKFYVLFKSTSLANNFETKDREFIGYFSKEKRPLKSYNLSCVLVSPLYQGQGYGRLLISLSYKVSLKVGFFGGPEEPLSLAAQSAYESFWKFTILSVIATKTQSTLSVKDISEKTGIEKRIVFSFLIKNKLLYQNGADEYFVQLSKKEDEWLKLENNRVKESICKEDGFCI